MKEKLSAVFIIILFCSFTAFNILSTNRKTVLNVITPVMLEIDLNNNHTVDDGETVCLPGTKSYTSNLVEYKDEIKELPFQKGLAVGYLADEFTHKLLDGKEVKIKETGNFLPQCKIVEIYLDNRKYSDILKESGFGIANGKPANELKFKEILAKAENLKLVIYNHKSGKYHKPECKYGRIAHDAVVLSVRDLPESSSPCKFCHITKTKSGKKHKTEKFSVPPPNIITNGSIKIILTDFTKILKPDKNCNHTACREFVSLIDNSNASIDIALYGWTDIPKVRTSLENAMKRGVNIRVIYDTKTTSGNYYPDTEIFVKRFAQRRSDKIEGNNTLTNSLMHNKFAIFDNQKVFTGSMNFSHTGFSGFNQNSIIIVNSKAAAEIYTKEFNQMFGGKFHTLKEKTPNKILTLSDGSRIIIGFSPQDKVINEKLVPLVNSAKHSIYMPAFLITHKGLTNALINANKRGVDVKIILDATSTTTRHSTMYLLRQSGIPVKVENFAGKMHSKVVIIDDKYVVTGSTNFSNSGENKNDENMIIIENPKIAKFYSDFFKYLWKKIPDKYLKFNPPAESKYSIGSCSDGIDNDYDGKIDSADSGCSQREN